MKLTGTSVEMAEKSLRLYEERYRDGVASNLEWLDAQQAWLQALLTDLQARTDARRAAVDLARLGGEQ
jgi:outer membrane protein TolC